MHIKMDLVFQIILDWLDLLKLPISLVLLVGAIGLYVRVYTALGHVAQMAKDLRSAAAALTLQPFTPLRSPPAVPVALTERLRCECGLPVERVVGQDAACPACGKLLPVTATRLHAC